MTTRAGRRDQRLEQIVGTILLVGVIVSAVIAILGGALYLATRGGAPADYHVFQEEPFYLRHVTAMATAAAAGHPRAIMQLGIVLLLATPLMRVVLSAIVFGIRRDALYVVVALIVFSVLLIGLLGPHPTHR